MNMKLKAVLPFAIPALVFLLFYLGCSNDNGTEPATTGTLEIKSTPTGAAIFIDGVDKDKQTPSTFSKVEPDSYSVSLTRALYEDWDTTVAVAAGKKTIVNAALVGHEFVLTVNVIGQGSVIVSPDQEPYCCGDLVELTAEPNQGNVFEGWSGALTGDQSPDTISMTADKNVTATFSEIMEVIGGIRLADGGTLVRPIAFLDTSRTDTIVIFRSTGWIGDPETGDFAIQFYPQGLDSLDAIVAAFDDVNGNSAIDEDEPMGWWDLDGDGSWEHPDDVVTLRPGEGVYDADVVLYPRQRSASPTMRKQPTEAILEFR